jgi:hypothetical protein
MLPLQIAMMVKMPPAERDNFIRMACKPFLDEDTYIDSSTGEMTGEPEYRAAWRRYRDAVSKAEFKDAQLAWHIMDALLPLSDRQQKRAKALSPDLLAVMAAIEAHPAYRAAYGDFEGIKERLAAQDARRGEDDALAPLAGQLAP